MDQRHSLESTVSDIVEKLSASHLKTQALQCVQVSAEWLNPSGRNTFKTFTHLQELNNGSILFIFNKMLL